MADAQTDVLIIGAGPIGIELAVVLKREGIDYAQLDSGQIGSTISWYAPQTHFFSSPERIAIAGVPLQTLDQSKATREEYLNYLRGVVLQFDLEIHTYERVRTLRPAPDGTFEVISVRDGSERSWHPRRVVLAIGDMHRPRMLGIPGESLPHVSHYFADPHTYFRKRVVIVGGRNSAVEAAIRCVRIGADVTLIYRGTELDADHIKFWLYPEIQGLIRDKRMKFFARARVREIRERSMTVITASGESLDFIADFILLLTGYEQDPDLFVQAGVSLQGANGKPYFDERTMETNVPGLFVAGTAAAGTQSSGVKEFIETSHVHVERIVAALTGRTPPPAAPSFEMPES